MNLKTIAKNRTKLIDAILAVARDFKCYSLDNHFTGQPMGGPNAVKPPAEWLKYELRIGRHTKLQQTGPTSYCVHVHSNLWYEFTSDMTAAVLDARAGIVPSPETDATNHGAKCDTCHGFMLEVDGCIKTWFVIDGKRYDRQPYAGGYDPGTGRCGDCGAKIGHYHHPGCDVERCPVCHNQMIGCACLENAAEYALKGPTK